MGHRPTQVVEDTSYGGCSWAKVKEQMDTFVQNPTFCRELGVPTPDELWALLDNDPYLLGFDDGVYSFRDWRFYKKGEVPSSFATSMSCGYDFPGDENGDVPPEVASAVADFERDTIHKLTEGDLETRAQVKDMLGSELIGDPALFKVVPVVVGPGDNGKSVFSEGADASMGGYAGGFGRGTFYNQIESNGEGPKPELTENMKKRTATVHEAASKKKPGANGVMIPQPINGELVKEYSGGDPVPYRGLYENIQRGIPQFQLRFVANCVPDLRGADEATRKRLYPIELKCKFVKKAEEVDEANHVYLAESATAARDRYEKGKHLMMLLRIRYLKDLRARNYVMAPISSKSLAGAELRDRDMDRFIKEYMEESFTKTDGSLDPSKKTPEELENTLMGLTRLHLTMIEAMKEDDMLSERAAELTPAYLKLRLEAAGYTIKKKAGNASKYCKDPGKWVVHVAKKPAAPAADGGGAADAAGADAEAPLGVTA